MALRKTQPQVRCQGGFQKVQSNQEKWSWVGLQVHAPPLSMSRHAKQGLSVPDTSLFKEVVRLLTGRHDKPNLFYYFLQTKLINQDP